MREWQTITVILNDGVDTNTTIKVMEKRPSTLYRLKAWKLGAGFTGNISQNDTIRVRTILQVSHANWDVDWENTFQSGQGIDAKAQVIDSYERFIRMVQVTNVGLSVAPECVGTGGWVYPVDPPIVPQIGMYIAARADNTGLMGAWWMHLEYDTIRASTDRIAQAWLEFGFKDPGDHDQP